MASKLFSLFDEYQSQENAKHTQRAMRENARRGYWNGSIPPFGYRSVAAQADGNRGRKKRRLKIDLAKAEIVEKIYDLYLHGAGGLQDAQGQAADRMDCGRDPRDHRCWSL